MKYFASLLSVLTAVLLTGCESTSSHRNSSGPPATVFTVTVTCTQPSLCFTGTIVSDGRTRRVTGSGTKSFEVRGHELVCSFQKTGVEGQIALAVSSAGEVLGNAYTSKPSGGVRAEVCRTSEGPRNVFSTF